MYPIWVHCQQVSGKKIKNYWEIVKLAIICYMARKIQHSVRWEGWIANAIDAWAEENGKKTFSESVNYLLAVELERWGYKREKYEPGIKEMPLEREKRLAAEKKDAEITAQTLGLHPVRRTQLSNFI